MDGKEGEKTDDGVDPPPSTFGDCGAEIDLDEAAFDDRASGEVEFILRPEGGPVELGEFGFSSLEGGAEGLDPDLDPAVDGAQGSE
jgi:hypothetical protein